jgi:thiamine biosynthesis lipoprotein
MLQGQEGRSWGIDIQHPRPTQEHEFERLISMDLTKGGLATSGDYERFFIHEGQRYCHVLHPVSGWPVQSVQSVSVIAPSTTSAGAMTTIAMLKESHAKDWLLNQDVDFCLVEASGRLHLHKAGSVAI